MSAVQTVANFGSSSQQSEGRTRKLPSHSGLHSHRSVWTVSESLTTSMEYCPESHAESLRLSKAGCATAAQSLRYVPQV